MKKSNAELLFKILTYSPLFKGIQVDELQSNLEQIGFRQMIKKKGDVFVSAGDACTDLMILVQGSIKAEMVDYSGKTIKIEDISAPAPLAVAFLFGQEKRYPVNVTAMELTEIMIIDQKGVLALMQLNSRFLNNYLNMVCNKAQFLSKKLEFLSFKTIREKLANYLLANRAENTNTVMLSKSQEELADYFGVARQSLLRLLKEFQSSGLIRFKRRNIDILDNKGLVEILKKKNK